MSLLRARKGFSITWWSVFLAFVLVPLIVLAMGGSRYAIASAEMQEAADLASLAASRDILVQLFETEGYVQWADQVPYWTTERYVNSNTDYLAQHGITVRITRIYIDEEHDTVAVRVAGDLAPLFPDFGFPFDYTVEREGTVQLYMRAWVPGED